MTSQFDWTKLAEEIGGNVAEDISNVNGRFVTVAVSYNASDAARNLRRLAKPHFAHTSRLSVWDDEYSFQVTTKRPAILESSVIYDASEFGQQTDIKVVTR